MQLFSPAKAMITSMLAWLILVLISTKAHRSLIPALTTDTSRFLLLPYA